MTTFKLLICGKPQTRNRDICGFAESFHWIRSRLPTLSHDEEPKTGLVWATGHIDRSIYHPNVNYKSHRTIPSETAKKLIQFEIFPPN